MRQRQIETLHRLHVGGAHLRHVLDKEIFGKVIGDRCAREMLPRAEIVLGVQRLMPKRFVHFRAFRPGAAPIVPTRKRAEHVMNR